MSKINWGTDTIAQKREVKEKLGKSVANQTLRKSVPCMKCRENLTPFERLAYLFCCASCSEHGEAHWELDMRNKLKKWNPEKIEVNYV